MNTWMCIGVRKCTEMYMCVPLCILKEFVHGCTGMFLGVEGYLQISVYPEIRGNHTLGHKNT